MYNNADMKFENGFFSFFFLFLLDFTFYLNINLFYY